MVDIGAISEVKKFLKLRISKNKSISKAIGIAENVLFVNSVQNSSTCIPPIDPPVAQRSFLIPRWSRRVSCALTISLIVITGKFNPYGSFVFLSISLCAGNVLATASICRCKPQCAAAVRSHGIQVFKLSGTDQPVGLTITDGEGLYSGLFMVNNSKYEILDLCTGKAYAFDKNETWTHIQDIFFLDNDNLSFIIASNASITRYIF